MVDSAVVAVAAVVVMVMVEKTGGVVGGSAVGEGRFNAARIEGMEIASMAAAQALESRVV